MKKPKAKNLPKKAKSKSTASPVIAFLAIDEMAEFLNAQSAAEHAAERGEEKVLMPAALMKQIFTAVQPLDLEHLRVRFNQLCDEMGQPGEKVPEPKPIKYRAGKGPF